MLKTVRIAGDEFRLHGSEEDPYFGNLQAFIDGSPKLERYIKPYLPKDAICMDVGANIGVTTLMLCSHCPDGHVYSFEADPFNASYLRRNLAENGITNCTVINQAVSDEPGELKFHKGGAGGHMMTDAHPYRNEWSFISVDVTTIDDVSMDLRQLDFIKIDIEGFEPRALAGARDTISRFKPTLFMEFNSWCLYFAHRFDPMTFARSLWKTFDVMTIDENGKLSPAANGDAIAFLHGNMTANGCIDDLILRPRETIPSLIEMTRHPDDIINASAR